jgi:glutamate dehydrogenase (NAD(P)+)
MNYFWDKDDVLSRLDLKMTSAFQAVSALAKKRGIYHRDATFLIAVDRVARACRDRGWV